MPLAEICTSLAAQEVTLGGTRVPAFDAKDTPTALTSGQLPCRLILIGNDKGKGGSGDFIATGSLTRVVWTLSDILFLSPAGSGYQRHEIEPTLREYQDLYVKIMRRWRDAGVSQANVEDWQSTLSTVEYPAGSGHWYWTVVNIVRIADYGNQT